MPANGSSCSEVFDKLLLEIIDETLSCLGGSLSAKVYFHLEKSFGLTRPDIPNKVEEFSSALEQIFGKGAFLLESRIMRRLFSKACCLVECCAPEGFEFSEYIGMVKTSILLDSKNNIEIFSFAGSIVETIYV
jgi:hypothetical protein